MNLKLKKLNFSLNQLEPYLSKQNIEFHYNVFYKYYLNNINILLNNISDFYSFEFEILIKNLNLIPIKNRLKLKNYIEGYINHNFFWEGLGINNKLHNLLMLYIEDSFGSFIKFNNEFKSHGLSHIGSGWLWLVVKNKKLLIISTNNNDSLILKNIIYENNLLNPILVLDLWEHSYLLQYKYKSDYIKSFFKIINWDIISKRFLKIIYKYKNFYI